MTIYVQPKPGGQPTWTDLMTPDVQSAYKFYKTIFGWDYDIAGPEFGNYASARLGQYEIAGLMQTQPGDQTPTGWGLYFATHNIAADSDRAVALGATVISPVMQVGAFGSMAIFADPTGAMFGLWQADQHIGWQMAEQPGSIAWVEMYSSNAKQARDFYTALLSATADPMPGGLEYYVLKHGEQMLGGIMQIDPAWGNMPSQWVNYFAVANADETAALIAANGGKLMGAIDDSPFGSLAAAADPAGAIFKIIQPPTQ